MDPPLPVYLFLEGISLLTKTESVLISSSMAIASPRPTAAPDPQVVAERLRERQYGGQTCGWIDANFGAVIDPSVGMYS